MNLRRATDLELTC